LAIDAGVFAFVNKPAILFAATALSLMGAGWQTNRAVSESRPQAAPTFYRDVLPILQDHCQSCHRRGEVAPMPLETYEQTRPRAEAMAHAVQMKMMPPWFADPQ
jgi:uncharacterized membrane protein